MSVIKAAQVSPNTTVEVILHHNYPLEIIKNRHGLSWVVTKNTGGAKSKFVTHFVGRLMINDTDKKEFQIYGNPYAGLGLGYDMSSSGENYTAVAVIPWNYIMRMWVLTREDNPVISAKHNRLNVIKTVVKF